MKKCNMILPILQTVLTPEEVESIVKAIGYVDKARKFTVYHLLQYWCAAASEEWSGYRFGADQAACSGLTPVHYSCFSGKAADVPFTIFKELFQLLVRKCNRETRRKLAFPKELLLIDSTTITTRLPWAPYHGERAGVKLHVALRAQNGQPWDVTETIGTKHDGPICESLENPDFIMVMDRAYGKLERLDRYQQDGQSFVIRLRDNVHFEKPYALRRHVPADSSVIRDITCQLGTPQCRSKQRHRVVIFRDFEGREIRVVTDLMDVTAEQIALIYKDRWQIEVFFRWIKQHLNIPTLFGTTENAVYGQLFSALIVFVLLKWLFDGAKQGFPRHADLSFVRFTRLLLMDQLPVEWMIYIHRMISFDPPSISVTYSG